MIKLKKTFVKQFLPHFTLLIFMTYSQNEITIAFTRVNLSFIDE